MENKENIECSIMDEVREMRRKISAEFGHDLNRLVAYYQELENEMRESGKYKFVDLPSEKFEIEKNIFNILVSIRRKPEISAEFGHDLNRLVTYYQELENEMREFGKYKFADLPSEKFEIEKNIFNILVSVRRKPEKLEIINAQTKLLEYLLGTQSGVSC